ncbi:hypothetical protein MMC25_007590 [Agyrium rufum]|nr:hypothetical protein [Agyrium rufum]
MATEEGIILNHYNIASLFPTEWPAEKDESEDSGAEREKLPTKLAYRKSKSRYTVLERSASDRRSLVPNSEKTRDGVENLVQRDEADPLGATDSVVRALKQRGLPVDEDQRLRNRFLLSSTTFTPNLYLSQVHSTTSTQQLLQGLEFLSRSIDQKSASLKVLVESNFERFVRAKSTIDDVYTEMRNQGAEPEPEKPQRHSRHASKGSAHFRRVSDQASQMTVKGVKLAVNEKKKHALIKESEYGVQGIKAPLIEVAVKAEEVWGPALGGRDREDNLRAVLDSIEKSQDIFEIGPAIRTAVKRKDYDALVKEYGRARHLADEVRNMANRASDKKEHLTDQQIYQVFLTGRMWLEVESQIDAVKREIWRSLTSVQANLVMSADKSHQGDHVKLISVLLELGVEDNPIWVWLLSRYDYLKNRITTTFSRAKVEVEVLRRRLASGEKASLFAAAAHLKSLIRASGPDSMRSLDTKPVLELWELIYQSLNNLLSLQGGILGEVMDFWSHAQSFIDGKAQRSLPGGFDGNSRRHHRLSNDGVRDLRSGVLELVDMIRENVFSFFADPPIDDISSLYSPVVPETPNTPRSAGLSPFPNDHRLRVDLLNPPPPSPRRGEAWEEFAFWPPYANALSGVQYLSKIMSLLGHATNEMALLEPISSVSQEHEKLKFMLAAARERSARAICASWANDAEICKVTEDWTHSPENAETTRLPGSIATFEAHILSGLQKVIYMPDAAAAQKGTVDVITPPPTKLLQMIRSQFVNSIYKALSGMVENAEKPPGAGTDLWVADGDSVLNQQTNGNGGKVSKPNATDINLRLLLTLANLTALRGSVFPSLISEFENLFSVLLTEETKTINEVLRQIDERLLHTYTKPIINELSGVIYAGIRSPEWAPTTARPTEVRAYVYEALLILVRIYTQTSNYAPSLTHSTISHLLEQISSMLLGAFRERPKYTLSSLMQATLDVEFFAQSLTQFTSKKAGDIQGQVYMELDRRTDPNARSRLQVELPEMKAVLKEKKDGTRGEFACFKRVRTAAVRRNTEDVNTQR